MLSSKPAVAPRGRNHVESLAQIKTRERVRDLAEVYTHKREVDAMLDLVPGMFPSSDDPSNTDRKFLEPACGSGNFVEEILLRKLAFVTSRRYGRGERYEHRILRSLSSIYAVDINQENIKESRDRLRAVINSHLDNDLNTSVVTEGFARAVEVILGTNVILANTLDDADKIELVEYHPGRSGTFTREWSFLEEAPDDLFSYSTIRKDAKPLHYSDLAANPRAVPEALTNSGKATA